MLSFEKRGLLSHQLTNGSSTTCRRSHLSSATESSLSANPGVGGGSIALGSQNPKSVRAIIGFAAGRGGHFNGKPNNNCAPDQLVDAVAEFGRTARIPMLWIYTRNDSYFGPDLSKRMVEAFRAGGGSVEYHLLPDFGNDGHFLIDSADAVQLWAPMVSEFLAKHP
jgi:pimeloyl-ACP methyl ester carboxylesterase